MYLDLYSLKSLKIFIIFLVVLIHIHHVDVHIDPEQENKKD